MIKQNNKLLKANNKCITVINKTLFIIENTNTSNITRFQIWVSEPITIYFDNISLVVNTNLLLTSVNIALPEIKNYKVIIQDEDLPKIKGIYIGYLPTMYVKGVIFDRISKLINCVSFLIGTYCDNISQTINIAPFTNLDRLSIYRNYKTIDQSVLDKITTLTELSLDTYRGKINVTKLFQNNLNLIFISISTAINTNVTGEITIPTINNYNTFYIPGNITGDATNLKNSSELTICGINNANNVYLDTSDFITTKLKTLYTNINCTIDIEKLYSNLSSTTAIYIILRGTINGSFSDILDITSSRYNAAIDNKITNVALFNNIYILADYGNMSGKLHILLNKLRTTAFITYNIFNGNSSTTNFICDISQLNANATNVIQVSIQISWQYIKLLGDCQIFQTSSNRTRIILKSLTIDSNYTNIKYIVYPITTSFILFTSNTITQSELDSIPNTVFDRRTLYTYNANKSLIINENTVSISGTYQSPDLGTYIGNINDLTETQITNLSNGLDYTGSGSNTPWTTREKVWILVNLKVSSSNNTSRYKWSITY